MQLITQAAFHPANHQGVSLSQLSQLVPPEKSSYQPITTFQSKSSEDEVDEHELKLLIEVEIICSSLVPLNLEIFLK